MIISAVAFGGALPWARRKLVEERYWITEREFIDTLALCQFLLVPARSECRQFVDRGGGGRYRGLAGSAAAFAGIPGLPCIIVIAFGALYTRYSQLTAVHGALLGVSAAAVGMILGMAGSITAPLLNRRPAEASLVIVAVFVAVAPLRVPLPWALLVAASVSVALSWWWRT
jgi:chromate transporter